MYELKKIGKIFSSKFVETGLSSYQKIIYRTAVPQRLRNTALHIPASCLLNFLQGKVVKFSPGDLATAIYAPLVPNLAISS